jgi:hypothetical protein
LNPYDQTYNGGWISSNPIDETLNYSDTLDAIADEHVIFHKHLGDQLPQNIFELSDKHRSLIVFKYTEKLYISKHLNSLPPVEEKNLKKLSKEILANNSSHIVEAINKDLNNVILKKKWICRISKYTGISI